MKIERELDPKILKYVPKSKQDAILEAYHDNDGYWIILKDEYHASRFDRGCHTIHEDDIKHLRYQIAGIEKL
jgi:hypothetical protein